MTMELAVAIGAAGAALLVFILLSAEVSRHRRECDRRFEDEAEWRERADDRINERLRVLRAELETGFMTLGLEREPEKPAQPPSWKRPEGAVPR